MPSEEYEEQPTPDAGFEDIPSGGEHGGGVRNAYGYLERGPRNAYSESLIKQMGAAEMEGLRRDQNQALAGATMSQRSRGGGGPDLGSIMGSMQSMQNVGAGGMMELASRVEGGKMGLAQYEAESEFVNQELERAHASWLAKDLAASQFMTDKLKNIRKKGSYSNRAYQQMRQDALQAQAGFYGLMGDQTYGQHTSPQMAELASFLLTHPDELWGVWGSKGERGYEDSFNYQNILYDPLFKDEFGEGSPIYESRSEWDPYNVDWSPETLADRGWHEDLAGWQDTNKERMSRGMSTEDFYRVHPGLKDFLNQRRG